MTLKELALKAQADFKTVSNANISGIVGISRHDDGWRVNIEVLERKCIPDGQDLLAVFEVLCDVEGNMTSYDRKRVRRRMDLEEAVE